MPRITVMMPARNAGETIRAAIKSVTRSLPRDSQVVVWDDGSSDNTIEVVESLRDPTVRVLSSGESIGSGAARAQILLASDSELVANMDADDLCLPNRFRTQLPHLKQVDVSFMTKVDVGPNATQVRLPLPLSYNARDLQVALAFHNPLTHSTMLAKRVTLEEAGGYRNLRLGQDYDLWLRLARNESRLGRLATPGVLYRRSSLQVSAQPTYAQNLASQPLLVQAYSELLTALNEQISSQISGGLGLTTRAAKELIGFLRPHLRPYYFRIARTRRFTSLADNGSI